MPVLDPTEINEEPEEECERTVAALHIETVPGGAIPVIETFLLVVRALCEDERYDDAKKVWHLAKEVGHLSSEGLASEEEAIDRRQGRNEARSKRVASKL